MLWRLDVATNPPRELAVDFCGLPNLVSPAGDRDRSTDSAGSEWPARLTKFPFVGPFRFLTRFHQTQFHPVVRAPGGDFEEEDSRLGSAARKSC